MFIRFSLIEVDQEIKKYLRITISQFSSAYNTLGRFVKIYFTSMENVHLFFLLFIAFGLEYDHVLFAFCAKNYILRFISIYLREFEVKNE